MTWKTAARSGGYREYHHGAPAKDIRRRGVLDQHLRGVVGTIFRGIHMAGPNLTPETFVQGMFSYPPTGGQPAAPLVYFTRELPTDIKDFTEVWFDADGRGPDERGEQGPG